MLFAAPDGDAWANAVQAAADRLSLRLDVHRLGTAGLRDPDGGCADAYGLGRDGVVLIRPDGFVGWRATDAAEASAETGARALSALLARL